MAPTNPGLKREKESLCYAFALSSLERLSEDGREKDSRSIPLFRRPPLAYTGLKSKRGGGRRRKELEPQKQPLDSQEEEEEEEGDSEESTRKEEDERISSSLVVVFVG